jgi:hypothetical protein
VLSGQRPVNHLDNTEGRNICIHYRKQSLHRELEASARAKSPALGEGLAHGEQHLRRELSTLSSRRRVRLTAPQPQPSRPPTSVKFAESLEVRLSAKKKHTTQKHFHREHYTFGECFVSAHGEFSKKIYIFESKLFPWSTYTRTIYMFKIGTILSLLAIFNNFTSFFVFVSYMSDMNCKCIKS